MGNFSSYFQFTHIWSVPSLFWKRCYCFFLQLCILTSNLEATFPNVLKVRRGLMIKHGSVFILLTIFFSFTTIFTPLALKSSAFFINSILINYFVSLLAFIFFSVVQVFCFVRNIFKNKGKHFPYLKRRFNKTASHLLCGLFEATDGEITKAGDETHTRCKTHLNARDLSFVKIKQRALCYAASKMAIICSVSRFQIW